MRINRVNNCTAFTGVRQDRNTVEQLKKDNPYDLNLPNQRRISNAIEELSKVPGEDNINFLLDVSQNLRYGTSIDLGKRPYNDWREKLNKAAQKSLKLSDKSVQEKLSKKLEQAIRTPKSISPEEREIMANREILLSKINPEELANISNSNAHNLKKNLNYFVISSEIPTAQKLYILKRLNYMMSDDYHINPQLQDKKTMVLAEILNDIVVDTPESKIPNIKAINQKQHGMCVAISICRKALAYEDKANYVDMILTELDDEPNMMVYDRANLGKHQKVPIPKADIDYDYAIKKGYRIVDTSVMNWMNAADTVGAFNDVVGAYSAFDKANFGTFADTHIHKDIDDQSEKYQDYYRSCKKSKDALATCKKTIEKQKYYTSVQNAKEKERIDISAKDTQLLHSIIKQISPELKQEEVRKISNELLSLSLNYSDERNKLAPKLKQYSFIPNEEKDVKKQKIEEFLNNILDGNTNHKILKEKSDEIADIVEEIKSVNKGYSLNPAQKYLENKALFEAAAAYRTQQSFAFDIPEYLTNTMVQFNIPDNESYIIENLNTLSKNIRSGKINSELKEILSERFEKEIEEKSQELSAPKDELLATVLDDYANTVKLLTTTFMDDIYHSLLLGDRKQTLVTQLEAVKNEVLTTKDKEVLKKVSGDLKIKQNKYAIADMLDKYIETLSDENCTDEQYSEIYNKSGHKSQLLDLKEAFDNTLELLFRNPNPSYIKGFNIINGAPMDSDIETTQDLYKVLATSFNNMSMIIKTLQDTLQVTLTDGRMLNTADPKFAAMKQLEKVEEIATEEELISLSNKFDEFAKNRYSQDGTKVKFKDLPKSITEFTPKEKAALEKYKRNINSWYAESTRNLNDIYVQMKQPLEELNREIGVQKGEYWTRENESGLMENQALKIFEHMTDRPYYEETNIRSGLDKIKRSPYSATSMTSVKDNEPAMHAQYVVDVKPTVLTFEDTDKIKDIIFHDNSWGASEHENMWVDKLGMLRTDYSSSYGGQEGYITNEKYQNGKLEDNLVNKKGKFVPEKIPNKQYNKLVNEDREEYTFPMIRSLMMQGVSPKAMSTVKTIKQNLLLPSSEYIDDLSKFASEMSQDEIKSAIKRIQTAGESSRKTYALLLKRINGDEIFDKGIDSEEKYYNLSPNDKLRLMAEKVAIIKSYDQIPDINTYNIEVKSQKELDKLHKKLRTEARNNFDYIMGKNPDILKYATESARKDTYALLKEFAKDKNVNLSYKAMTKIVNSMKRIKNNNYDGSVSQGTDLMIANFEKYLKLKTDVSDEKVKEISAKVKSLLEKNLTITENDVKTQFASGRNEKIAAWIDREFAPKTDKEFAQILNNLRRMTNEDFKKNYDSKISDSDMGIDSINGYDVIKAIRSGNDSMKNSFINTVFSEGYYQDIEESKTRAYYDLKKLSRNLSGGTYIGGKRSFDDLYSDFYYNFQGLTIKKEFDKYKDEAFRKYFAFPAYPLVEISTEEELENSLNTFNEKLNNYMDFIYAYKNQQASLELVYELKHYADSKLVHSGDMTPKQYSKITRDLSRLMALNSSDETLDNKKEEARLLFASGTKDNKAYKDYINSLYDLFRIYEKTADGKTMKEAEQVTLKNIDIYKKTYVMSMFEPKYQGKALELLNKWISAKSKAVWVKDHFNPTVNEESSEEAKAIAEKYTQNVENADEIFEKFKDLFMKHRLLASPDRYMNEYLLLCAKDAKHPDRKYDSNSDEGKQAIKDMRETFKTNLKSLLYKADMMELQYTLMDCAKKGNLNAVRDAFRNSTLELTDGSVVTMDSEEGLNLIISPMLQEENLDTAALFLNQLGLSEKVAKMISDKTSLDIAYKNFNRIQAIIKSSDSQAKFAREEVRKLGNIDNDANYEQIILDLKQRLMEKAKRTSFSTGASIFEAALDDAIKEIKSQPDQSKTLLLGTNIDLAIAGLREVVKANINYLNQPLQVIQKRYDLIKKLLLPDNSPIAEDAAKYVEALQELLEYEHSVQKSYPHIGITSE